MERGIVVASDQRIEWLLPIWWKYYTLYNNFPVAFVDLGMSSKMRAWCKRRGKLIRLEVEDFVYSKKELPPERVEEWPERYWYNVWKAREAWFKKPFACLQSPFDLTAWIDIDCEICGPLEALFDEWVPGIELAIVREEWVVEQKNFNSGVMLFSKNASFLKKWADLSVTENHRFMGDQNVLTELIYQGEIRFKELSPVYNWLMSQGLNISVLIAHWAGRSKEHLRLYGGIHELLGRCVK